MVRGFWGDIINSPYMSFGNEVDDPDDYIHRVGRTARGANGAGKALLFIFEHELGFLRYLKQQKIDPLEFEFPENKLANVQD